ncbi:MAG: CoA ester lyase [Devosia sp.]
MTIAYPALRRCCLTVPGSSPRMLAKAASIAVDELVLDLEDGVVAAEKESARAAVVAALTGSALEGRQVAVRVNAIGTPWCHDDIVALAAIARDRLSLVLPKVESAADIGFVERLLPDVEAADRPTDIGLQCLIETAAGLAGVASIAAAGGRLEGLVIGYGDLASSLGYGADVDWSFVQQTVLLAARVNGIDAIDGPYFALGSAAAEAGLARACLQAAGFGFDGKWAIHPAQVATITSSFMPTEAELARAEAIVRKLDAARSGGAGVALLDGSMIDEAMRLGAMRILARARTAQ